MREPFRNARTYITTLLMLEVFLGVTMIVLAGVSEHVLGTFLATAERKVLSSQFFNAYTLGFQLVVTYLFSLTMWRRLWLRRCTPNVRVLLHMWLFFCFLIVLCGFGNIWTLLTSGEAVETTVEASLHKGIDKYYSCPEWKLLWDALQYHKECCGVRGYKDWMGATWMPHDTPSANSSNDECLETKKPEAPTTVLAPYACCKHNCNSCYQNYLPGGGTNKIPDLNLTQINTCGCMPLFSSFMWKVLYWLLALVLIAFKVEIIICGLTKYIMKKQADYDESCAGSNAGLTDDEGRPLVIVKCPPNVRCVTFDEDESSNCQCPDSHYHHDQERGSCSCCGGSSKSGKKSKQERMRSRESRILH